MSRLLTFSFALVIALGLAGLRLSSRPASASPAAIFSLNSTLDQPDANLTDGTCQSTPSGLCTLRAAVQQANYTGGPDTIILQPGLTYRLTRPGQDDAAVNGDLDITESLVIEVLNAGQATIDGNGAVTGDRVFWVSPAAVDVAMEGVVIENGQALGVGGGIWNQGELFLGNVTVHTNTATIGGGLFNNGDLGVMRSTISGNHALFDGGGLANFPDSSLTLVNSTVSGNSANGFGGGLYANHGTANLYNTTVVFNRADRDTNGNGSGGGIFAIGGSIVRIQNTILGENKRGLILGSHDDDCAGTLESGDYNLIETMAGCAFTGGPTHHQSGSPLLGSLQDNGGPTPTHALQPGSPAIDKGNATGCRLGFNPGIVLSLDQRLQPRAADGDGDGSARCDIGAYELQPAPDPDPGPSQTRLYLPLVLH